jgi:hypothetical protein
MAVPLIGAGTTDGRSSVVRNLGCNCCVDTVPAAHQVSWRWPAFASASGQHDWPVAAWHGEVIADRQVSVLELFYDLIWIAWIDPVGGGGSL